MSMVFINIDFDNNNPDRGIYKISYANAKKLEWPNGLIKLSCRSKLLNQNRVAETKSY